MFEAREALEGMATRLAAMRATATPLRDIDRALSPAGTCPRRRDREGFAAAGLNFHAAVAAASPAIERQLAAIYARALAMCRGRPPGPDLGALVANQAQHRAIAKAIHAGDADAAERLGREHVVRPWSKYWPVA